MKCDFRAFGGKVFFICLFFVFFVFFAFKATNKNHSVLPLFYCPCLSSVTSHLSSFFFLPLWGNADGKANK